MKKKNKSFITLCVALTLVFMFQIVAYAANTWSENGTFRLDSNVGVWVNKTTENEKLSDKKKNDDDPIVTVRTITKTMSSYPKFKLVNSENNPVSEKITTADIGQQVDGANTGRAGYTYYASLAAAWNQITNAQTIKIKFDSH